MFIRANGLCISRRFPLPIRMENPDAAVVRRDDLDCPFHLQVTGEAGGVDADVAADSVGQCLVKLLVVPEVVDELLGVCLGARVVTEEGVLELAKPVNVTSDELSPGRQRGSVAADADGDGADPSEVGLLIDAQTAEAVEVEDPPLLGGLTGKGGGW